MTNSGNNDVRKRWKEGAKKKGRTTSNKTACVIMLGNVHLVVTMVMTLSCQRQRCYDNDPGDDDDKDVRRPRPQTDRGRVLEIKWIVHKSWESSKVTE